MSLTKTNASRILFSIFLTICFAFVCSVSAQTVDTTFDPAPSAALTDTTPVQQVTQPDGKVIVFGFKGVADGVAKGDIFRLNADGTLDTTFTYCGCGLTRVTSLKLMADGRMIVAGAVPGFAKIIRLNSDGSIDPTYLTTSPGPDPAFLGFAEFVVNAVQADGKVFATRQFMTTGHSTYYFRRYNADGAVDAGFEEIPLVAGSPASASVLIEFLGDGRFLMAVTSGTTSSGATIRRRNSDGSVDGTFESPSFAGPGFPSVVSISDIALETDGSVLVAGRWETVNGLSKRNLVRILPGGSVDLDFNAPNGFWGGGVHVQSDGKILFSVNLNIFNPIYKIFRLNANGSTDDTFVQDASINSILNAWVVDSSNRIVCFASTTSGPRLLRLLSSGAIDNSFSPNVTIFGQVYSSVTGSDGKVVLAGDFIQMNGVARRGIARVNADGSLDPTFNPGTGFGGAPPEKLLIQSDGKILALGPFVSYNGTFNAERLLRINPDGTRDNSFVFDVSSGRPSAMALTADRKILVGGDFSSVNGILRTGIARLFPDGSPDGFNPIIANPQIRALLVQPDGLIMVGGTFAGVNGLNRTGLVRLRPDGSVDQTFTANISTAGIWQRTDGKYVITTGTVGSAILRRNSDGTPDAGFTPPTFEFSGDSVILSSVALQGDGGLIVGGRFSLLRTASSATDVRHIIRLAPNGTHDTSFMPSGADAFVRSISRYSSTRLIVGGEFTSIADVTRLGIARLSVTPAQPRTLFDFNGDGRADITVFRPSSGIWYELYSGGTVFGSPTFGSAGDTPTPADFDGDGVTDEAIFHPSTGEWWYSSSLSNEYASVPFGQSGDMPRPFDYDGDGKADFVVYRPSDQTWYRFSTFTGYAPAFHFGSPGDIPVTGDFDGDGKGDIAIFRPSTGVWWYAASSQPGSFRATLWGQDGDIPVPADFDGDGKTDIAVFRPSNGVWYVLKSSDLSYISVAFGTAGDRPVAADYDGDGKADVAVYRPSEGNWYLLQSTAGFSALQWGVASDSAIPSVFLP